MPSTTNTLSEPGTRGLLTPQQSRVPVSTAGTRGGEAPYGNASERGQESWTAHGSSWTRSNCPRWRETTAVHPLRAMITGQLRAASFLEKNEFEANALGLADQ